MLVHYFLQRRGSDWMNTVKIKDNQDDYNFIIEQEVLNEYAAGIWADYVSYCMEHNIDTGMMQHPMEVRAQEVYECKRKIIENGECKNMEELEQIKERLMEMKVYLQEIKENELRITNK